VYNLRAFAEPSQVEDVVATLAAMPEVRHVVLGGLTADSGKMLVTAEVEAASVDEAFAALRVAGVPVADLSVHHVDYAHPAEREGMDPGTREHDGALVWAEVADAAVENVGLRPAYLAYMTVAGVIAAFGVLERSSVLIVGAMAVSPDLLPMSAACVAVVARRLRLLGNALATLVPGLALVLLTAFVLTSALRLSGEVSPSHDISSGVIGALATVNVATVGVAVAAGVAGMLAFETRASFAVGVAISVTTIPAAAYVGVAAGLEQWDGARGAVEVLVVNLAMLFLAGIVTLALQALYERRRGHRARPSRELPRAGSAAGREVHPLVGEGHVEADDQCPAGSDGPPPGGDARR
jgi:uncharacterized hydrophobic protein (TIGR00271 family)